jgi:hypothetical protein
VVTSGSLVVPNTSSADQFVGPNKTIGGFTVDDLLSSATPSSASLRDSTRATFLNGDATHMVLDEPLTVFRSHGGNASKVGRFTTLDVFDSRVDTRNGLALLQEWGNSVTKLTTVELPKGTSVWVGKAAPQVGKNGTTLPGGASQIFIDGKLDADWFTDTKWFRSERSKN